MWFIILLVVLALSMSIAVMLGTIKPISWATISAFFGGVYIYMLETKANFTMYVVEPGYETLLGVQPITVYNLGAMMLVLAMILIGIIALINLITSWTKNKPVTLWR